ncbi:YegJ family protein [Chitinophaga vietnamensis]|uniref:YegJ family protein n=1 Tax=Chitinophaga vietnamensis TaxID=2593957 RepID=UPI001177CC48|nr:DUF2314 domain-containing protein [Chitinophaga vietnamensis]
MSLFSRLFGKKNSNPPPEGQPPGVVQVANENERMRRAFEKAGTTLWYFKASVATPQPGQNNFSAKIRITDGDTVEYIWLNDPSFDDEGNLYGIVGNTPQYVQTVKQGQQIGVDPTLIADWMIVENNRLIGGYTTRAIWDGMSTPEKASLAKQLHFFIDEGADHFPHDFSTPEGAILCLEDALEEQNMEKAIACKDFITEAQRMLKDKFPEMQAEEEVVNGLAEALQAAFEKSFEDNGYPSFKHLLRSFPEKQQIDEHTCLVTEVCIYPDGGKSRQQLLTCQTSEGWRVLNPVN